MGATWPASSCSSHILPCYDVLHPQTLSHIECFLLKASPWQATCHSSKKSHLYTFSYIIVKKKMCVKNECFACIVGTCTTCTLCIRFSRTGVITVVSHHVGGARNRTRIFWKNDKAQPFLQPQAELFYQLTGKRFYHVLWSLENRLSPYLLHCGFSSSDN